MKFVSHFVHCKTIASCNVRHLSYTCHRPRTPPHCFWIHCHLHPRPSQANIASLLNQHKFSITAGTPNLLPFRFHQERGAWPDIADVWGPETAHIGANSCARRAHSFFISSVYAVTFHSSTLWSVTVSYQDCNTSYCGDMAWCDVIFILYLM